MNKYILSIAGLLLLAIQFSISQTFFEEKIIAGSENDFMIVRYIKIKGTNKEIGEKIGQLAKQLKQEINSSSNHLRNKLQVKFMEFNYPIHYKRMMGVAEEYGTSLKDYSRDFSGIPYLPSRGGCSVVFYPASHTENNHNIVSRNQDFPVDYSFLQARKELHICSRPTVFEIYPDTGYSAIYICAMDLLGGVIDGMNSEGLSVAVLGESDGVKGFQPEPSSEVGLDEFLILRYLLDNCKNVEEAKECLLSVKQYYHFAPMHYMIADKEGHSFIFEFSRHRNQSRIIDGKGIQCVTNHLVSDPDTINISHESLERLNILNSLTQSKEKFSIDDLKKINSRVSPWMPDYRPAWPTSRTLWHSLYDLNSKTLTVKFYLGEQKDPKDSDRIITRYSDYIGFKFDN